MTKSSFAGIFRRGIDEKALEQRAKASKTSGNRLGIGKGETKKVQFYGAPDADSPYWMEFPQHVWMENGRWQFVPCAGEDECDICQDEDDKKAKTSNGFACAVWSFPDKAPKVLTGPQGLLVRIIYRWRRAEDRFAKRVWEVTRFNQDKTEYDVSQAEERPISLQSHPAIDLEKYLLGEIARYKANTGGSKQSRKGPSSLDDLDDDEEDDLEDEEEELDEDEGPTKDDLMDREEYPLRDLLDYAEEVGARIPSAETKNRTMIVRRIIKKRGY